MNVCDFEVRTIDGQPQSLAVYRDKVLLVVNVASRCGYTPQYAQLEALYRKHSASGLVVLGFPCNQFGNQEPGDDKEIREFCATNYNVTFPMFAKIEVNGEHAHPLYEFLTCARKGILGTEAVKWNFTKFLIDRHGAVVARFAPSDTPEHIEPVLLPLLA